MYILDIQEKKKMEEIQFSETLYCKKQYTGKIRRISKCFRYGDIFETKEILEQQVSITKYSPTGSGGSIEEAWEEVEDLTKDVFLYEGEYYSSPSCSESFRIKI